MKNLLTCTLALLLITSCFPPGTVPTDQQLLQKLEDYDSIFQVTFDKANQLRKEDGFTEYAFDASYYLKSVQDHVIADGIRKYFYVQDSRALPSAYGDGVLLRCATVEREIDGRTVRIEKGYAVLEGAEAWSREPLDSEPEGYEPGTILFRHYAGAVFIYYLRHE